MRKLIARWRKALGWRLVNGSAASKRVVIVLTEHAGRVMIDHHGLPTPDDELDVPTLSRAQIIGLDALNQLQGRQTGWSDYVRRLH